MKAVKLIRRFAMPGVGITVIFWLRYRAFISHRAEADLSSSLHIGRHTKISSFAKIKVAEGPLHIGERCSIASGCFISSGKAGTRIGDDCLIGPNCTIVSGRYRFDQLDVPLTEQGLVSIGTTIGNNVFIGSNCAILDGSAIEDNVVIAAHSLVSGRIPKNSVAQGNPAKVTFTRR